MDNTSKAKLFLESYKHGIYVSGVLLATQLLPYYKCVLRDDSGERVGTEYFFQNPLFIIATIILLLSYINNYILLKKSGQLEFGKKIEVPKKMFLFKKLIDNPRFIIIDLILILSPFAMIFFASLTDWAMDESGYFSSWKYSIGFYPYVIMLIIYTIFNIKTIISHIKTMKK